MANSDPPINDRELEEAEAIQRNFRLRPVAPAPQRVPPSTPPLRRPGTPKP